MAKRLPKTGQALIDKLGDPREVGFSRVELAELGVSWPPAKGWRRTILKNRGMLASYRKKIDEFVATQHEPTSTIVDPYCGDIPPWEEP
jgi:hypothetical protein